MISGYSGTVSAAVNLCSIVRHASGHVSRLTALFWEKNAARRQGKGTSGQAGKTSERQVPGLDLEFTLRSRIRKTQLAGLSCQANTGDAVPHDKEEHP
jgi:hypothetical protein